MSKAAKQILAILFLLLFVSLGFAGMVFLEKQSLEKTNLSLSAQVDEFQRKETQLKLENKNLAAKIEELEKAKSEVEAAKAEIEKRVQKADEEVASLKEKIETLTRERDQLAQKISSLEGERDQLLVKVQKPSDSVSSEDVVALREKIKELEEERATYAQNQGVVGGGEGLITEKTIQVVIDEAALKRLEEGDDQLLAEILKERARLEIEVDTLKDKISESMVEIVELKKRNSDLQISLNRLKNEREEIVRKIKESQDLADSLSLDLARAQNDKKFFKDRLAKIKDENIQLQENIKRLTSTKISLEKSLVRIQEEKKAVERKLAETENVIQSRIDEIWKIKDDLQKNFESVQDPLSSSGIELTPIIVTAGAPSVQEGKLALKGDSKEKPGFSGSVVSVNEDNNFVIVDIGEKEGLNPGDKLSVYRGVEYVAGLEVIQVRKDIAAADIKNKVAKIRVGDVVR